MNPANQLTRLVRNTCLIIATDLDELFSARWVMDSQFFETTFIPVLYLAERLCVQHVFPVSTGGSATALGLPEQEVVARLNNINEQFYLPRQCSIFLNPGHHDWHQ